MDGLPRPAVFRTSAALEAASMVARLGSIGSMVLDVAWCFLMVSHGFSTEFGSSECPDNWVVP